MFLSRKGYGILKEDNEEIVEYFRKLLTVKPKVNPENPGGDLVKEFPVYKENSTKLYIPKYLGLKTYGLPPSENNTLSDGLICNNLIFKGSLRPIQEEPVRLFLEAANDPCRQGGIITLPCGFGKTLIALYLACQIKKKTMVICHKGFLIDQWKERIAEFIPTARVGLLNAQIVDIEDNDIVVASLQSLAMKDYDPKLFENFGMSIFDECHHLSAEVFSRALVKCSFRVMLGLSATLNRKDGLRKVFEWYIGHPVNQIQKRSDKNMIVKMINFYESHESYGREIVVWNGKRNIPKMINAICEYDYRTKLIIDELKEVLDKEPDRHTIIISDRRNHLNSIEKEIKLRMPAKTIGYYVGGMSQKDLKESESKNILLGTYTMVSEGFDVPTLNTLVLASPISSIEQSIGRIQRQKEADRKYIPIVIDFWDNYSLFKNQGFKRHTFYKKNGYDVQIKNIGTPVMHFEETKKDKNTKKVAILVESDGDL